MQRSGHRACAFPFLAHRLPQSLQRSPHRFPVLRRRFHHRFLDFLFEQPFGERSQLFRVAAEQPPFKLVFTVDFDVRHNHCQHLLMDINSRDPVRHNLLLAGAESVLELL